MSATVRMPDRTSLKYNDATQFRIRQDGWVQLEDGKSILVLVPPTCLVEWVRPCAINGASLTDANIVKEAINICERKDRRNDPSGYDLAKLKKLLAGFSAVTHRWK